jgi:hypothetical protein
MKTSAIYIIYKFPPGLLLHRSYIPLSWRLRHIEVDIFTVLLALCKLVFNALVWLFDYRVIQWATKGWSFEMWFMNLTSDRRRSFLMRYSEMVPRVGLVSRSRDSVGIPEECEGLRI